MAGDSIARTPTPSYACGELNPAGNVDDALDSVALTVPTVELRRTVPSKAVAFRRTGPEALA